MKNCIAFFVILFFLVSCSNDDESIKFHMEILPIETAPLPTEFKKDSIYTLPFTYIRPTNCHIYEGFYYEKNANKRTIAIQTSVLEQDNCGAAPINPVEETLNFKPTTETSYIFRLFKGTDAAGQDIFEEIEIPVIP